MTDIGMTGRLGEGREHRNEVWLVGRIAAPAETREMPSGAVLATVRLVVHRPTVDTGTATPGAPARRAPAVDAIDCALWSAELQDMAREWVAGDVVEIGGALRRRWWKQGAAVQSRYDVEVRSARRLQAATA